jgi:membrane protease YdiL (CAAX protease family)
LLQAFDPQSIATELNDLAAARNDPTLPLDALAFLLALIDATNEEVVYRRILQTCFSARYGLAVGVIGTAVVFGAIHASIPAALAGLWLGLLYLLSGRLWVAAVAHAVGNLGVFAMAAMQRPGVQGVYLATCYLAAAVMMVVMIWAIMSVRRTPLRRESP